MEPDQASNPDQERRRLALIAAAATWAADGINDPRAIMLIADRWERWVLGEVTIADVQADIQANPDGK